MGVSYMILRTAIDEAGQRARLCAVLSILVTADLPIVWYSIEWFRTQHPAPVLRGSGTIDPAMKAAIYSNVLPLLLIGAALVLIRMRQEQMRREIDGMRRLVHAL
jgi:heme exporter protein C